MDKSLLTMITFLPLLGAAAMLIVPSRWPELIRAIAVVTTGIVFLLTLYLWRIADLADGGYDARTWTEVPWIRIPIALRRIIHAVTPNTNIIAAANRYKCSAPG